MLWFKGTKLNIINLIIRFSQEIILFTILCSINKIVYLLMVGIFINNAAKYIGLSIIIVLLDWIVKHVINYIVYSNIWCIILLYYDIIIIH